MENIEIIRKVIHKAIENDKDIKIWNYGEAYYMFIFSHAFAKVVGYKLEDLGLWCDQGKEPLKYIEKFLKEN